VLGAVVESRSALEQHQALAAVLEMVPRLDRQQRESVEATIATALDDERRSIAVDPSRMMLARAIRPAL